VADKGSGTEPDQIGDLLGGAQIDLASDAGLALDPATFDQVVVELMGFFLDDERGYLE